MQKNSRAFWASVVIFGLVGQIAWVVENMYLNVFLYKMFSASAADISRMVSWSAVSATLTTVLVGALSDKIGRRRIFISGGYILWGISILGFALIRREALAPIVGAASASAVCITLVIVLDCVMTFFGSTANDAAFNAWLTEAVPEGGRGRAEGLNAMMPLVAILAVFGGFMAFDLDRADSWTWIFIIIGALTLLIGILGIFLIRDTAERSEVCESYLGNLLYGFRPRVFRENVSLYLSLGAFALFCISIQIFMPYLILYYSEGLEMQNYVVIMAPAIVLASVFTALYGRAYDKWGFALSAVAPLAALGAGYAVLALFTHVVPVFVGSLLMMCGYLSGMAVFGAVIRDRIPARRAGGFQGLRIIAQVLIPGVIGPALGAWVLRDAQTVIGDDGTAQFIPNASIFVAALVALGVLVLAMVAAALLLRSGGGRGEADAAEERAA